MGLKFLQVPFTLDNLVLHSHGSHEDYEGNEGHEVWQQSHDKGCSYQDTCRAARNEDKSVLWASRELGNPCHGRGEGRRAFSQFQDFAGSRLVLNLPPRLE